jgi:thiol-disulfide isomerase/thioredoxin
VADDAAPPISPPAAPRPGFPRRLGLLVLSPSRALAAIAESRSGGVRDALYLVGISVLAFRSTDLLRAVLALVRVSGSAGLSRLWSVVGSEVSTAGVVVLGSALLITLAAGRGRRDPGAAIELGGACYAPYFVVWSPVRLFDGESLLGYPPHLLATIANVVAWAWVGLLVVLAVRTVRGRPPRAPARRATIAGGVVLAVPALALVLASVWSARHYDLLRPLGRSDAAPGFSLPRIDGQPGELDLRTLRGRVVLLDFWATWCPPCLAMLPTLHDLYREWQPRGVEFVGIDSDGAMATRAEVTEFVAQHAFPYPVVIDDKQVGGLYGVFSIPHLVVIGRDGKIIRVFVGGVGRAQLAAALAAAAD